MLFSPLNRIYVFLKCRSIAPHCSQLCPWQPTGKQCRSYWFWRPDVAAEAALCPYKSVWSLTAQEPPVKEKSQIFLKGVGERGLGWPQWLQAHGHSFRYWPEDCWSSNSRKQLAPRGNQTPSPAVCFARSEALLASRGACRHRTPRVIRASVFITSAIRQRLATGISHYWHIRSADSHCFAPLLKSCEHTERATCTHGHPCAWPTASRIRPLPWQPPHGWVCCLQQWLGWWIPHQLHLQQGNQQNLGQIQIPYYVCSVLHQPLVSQKKKKTRVFLLVPCKVPLQSSYQALHDPLARGLAKGLSK